MIPIDREPDIEWLDEQIEKRDQLRKLLVRLVALVLVIAFIPLAFSGVLYLFGLPSLRLMIESRELSNDPAYRAFRSAVVAIRADNRQGTGFAIQIPVKTDNDSSSNEQDNPPTPVTETVVVTNHHIVLDAEQVEIGLKSDVFHPAITWLQWPAIDLAMIRLQEAGSDIPTAFSELTPLPLTEESTKPSPGDLLIVIGNPLGLFQVTTQVTYIGQTTLSDIDSPVLMVRGPVFRGNSGSPVIDTNGQVIGMVFAVAEADRADYGNALTRGSILTAAKDRVTFLIPAVSIREQLNGEMIDAR